MLITFSQEGPLKVREVLDEVICYTHAWSDELVALRTIQTLSIMDVQNYRRHIWNIGDYGDDQKSNLHESSLMVEP